MLRYARYTAYLLLLLLLTLQMSHAGPKEAKPQVLMSATYEGKISGWNVELQRTLTQYPDGRYLLRSYASKVFASIEETSSFIVKEGRVMPQEYRYERSVFGKKSTEKIVFEWENKRALYTRSDRKQNNTEHKLTHGVLDPALYQLAIQADLAKGHEGLHYRFIKRKRIEQYHLKAKMDETLAFAGKNFEAAVVLREDPDSDKSTKVWSLPSHSHVIAKIQHTDKDGDEFEITLSKFAVAEKALNDFYQSFSNNDNSRNSLAPEATQ